MVTYNVTNTNDSGAGTLRQAIADANANALGVVQAIYPNLIWGFTGIVIDEVV